MNEETAAKLREFRDRMCRIDNGYGALFFWLATICDSPQNMHRLSLRKTARSANRSGAYVSLLQVVLTFRYLDHLGLGHFYARSETFRFTTDPRLIGYSALTEEEQDDADEFNAGD